MGRIFNLSDSQTMWCPAKEKMWNQQNDLAVLNCKSSFVLNLYTSTKKDTLAHSAVSYNSHSYNYLVVAVVVVEAEK